MARRLVKYRADKATQRVDELATKCNEGELTPAERREYGGYVRAIRSDCSGTAQTLDEPAIAHRHGVEKMLFPLASKRLKLALSLLTPRTARRVLV
jgi:hypothetical protein